MNNKEAIEWLNINNCLQLSKKISVYMKRVLVECLNANKEEILIISDVGLENKQVAPILAGAYYFAAESLNLNAKLILQKVKFKGDIADDKVLEAISSLANNSILILSLSRKLGSMKELGDSFRIYAKEKNLKFISATNLGDLETRKIKDVTEAIDIDYEQLQERAGYIQKQLESASEIRVTTDAGTDLWIGVKGKNPIANVGNYRMSGQGGNLPAGEIYIPPKGRNVKGKVVIDGSSANRFGTELIKTPITLTIENGEIISIEGKEEAKKLKETLEWARRNSKYPWGIKRIGEFGIGINPKAKIIGTTIVDEKTLGTAHIAIGSNYWFGGTIYSIIHLDQVFMNPKIYIDGKLLNLNISL